MINQEQVINSAIKKCGIEKLNRMQQSVLNAGQDKDLVLISPTGSGKTLAFLLPILLRIDRAATTTQAVIVAPSRELALQIENVWRSLGSGLKVTCCYGGHPLRVEKKSLETPPSVLVGTPGRLADHIYRENISLADVKTLVLDEFDKSLELGFEDEMEYILEGLTSCNWRVLTSATEGLEIPAYTGLVKPLRMSFTAQMKTNRSLEVKVVKSPEKDKLETLYKLLGELHGDSALVFCNFRDSVERISEYLTSRGVENDSFHGGMDQMDREQALSLFRNGSATVFVSTDLASRGLDIPEVKNVIHYHLPINEESYVHRNGRTARMYAGGTSYLILNPVEEIPAYIKLEPEEFFLPAEARRPIESEWVTLTINKGKRDKLSKKDVVGFLYQKGELKKEDLGVVEIKESRAYAAVKREVFKSLMGKISNQRIKNMNAKFN